MYNPHTHLAFTTKYRHGALTDPILTRCQHVRRERIGGGSSRVRRGRDGGRRGWGGQGRRQHPEHGAGRQSDIDRGTTLARTCHIQLVV